MEVTHWHNCWWKNGRIGSEFFTWTSSSFYDTWSIWSHLENVFYYIGIRRNQYFWYKKSSIVSHLYIQSSVNFLECFLTILNSSSSKNNSMTALLHTYMSTSITNEGNLLCGAIGTDHHFYGLVLANNPYGIL